MFKYKVIFILLLTASLITPGFCQVKIQNHQIKTAVGTVINVDSVGNVITIRTDDQNQMAFSVPDKVSITQETRDIGLMDIREANPVTIQYYVSAPGKYTVINIVDNAPAVSQ